MNRITRVKETINEKGIDAILISSVPNITYLTGYTGFSPLEREAYLLITKKNNYIITDGRYTTAVKELIKNFALRERSVDNTTLQIVKYICKDESLQTVGFEENDVTYVEYKGFKKIVKELKPVSLRRLRIIKEPNEIRTIQDACQIGDQLFPLLLKKLRVGITEKELAWIFEKYVREHGAELSFPTIVAFGKNSATPHHTSSDQRLMTNDIILVDCGVLYKNYCSDMTRTVFFGKATDEQKRMYQTVLDAQEKTVNYLNHELGMTNKDEKGINAAGVDNKAREYITSFGYPTIPHSLGHGIGIEVHEAPYIGPRPKDYQPLAEKDILTEGMVFSIEPGIYLPGNGGIRIEDLYTIRNNTLLQLTQSPKSFIQI